MAYRKCLYALAACSLAMWSATSFAADERQGLLIRLDSQRGIVVERVQVRELPPGVEGLLFLREPGQERLIRITPDGRNEAVLPSELAARVSGQTRGGTTTNDQLLALSTVQIDQLASGEVLRGDGTSLLLTPQDQGVQLNPRMTIRRLPAPAEPFYPEAECVLRQGRTELLRFTFPAGQNRLTWSEIPGVPEALETGLPPGRYLLEIPDAESAALFTIAASEVREAIQRRLQSHLSLLDRANPLLGKQILAMTLLQPLPGLEEYPPFFVDAYDLLDTDERTDYLQELHGLLHGLLSGEDNASDSAETVQDSTEIPRIDEAREALARGEWLTALDLLHAPELATDPRGRGLAALYRGVILAESGAATGADAESAFQEAVTVLAEGRPDDRFRLHNNYANFLLRRVQDQLYNSSLRAAAGSGQSLFEALEIWQAGREHFEEALALGRTLGPRQEAAVAVNLSRHDALLSDLIHVLNSTIAETDRFEQGERFAAQRAAELAEMALQAGSDVDLMTRAAAAEARAHLAHRAAEPERCREYAKLALEAYTQAGSLVGAEGVYRLIGLSFLDEDRLSPAPDESRKHQALEALQVSHALSELLRQQFPSDTIGLSRAGFLARRAYVNDRIVELLIGESRFEEALSFLEAAKARSLRDMLTAYGTLLHEESDPAAELFQDWPERTAGLVYFLGIESAWVFAVAGPGQIQACPLVTSSGEAISPPELIARVRRFLSGMESAAAKMLRSASRTKPFDDRWQHELHEFYQILIPASVRDEIAAASNVVIVPQHILHYFPFSALVTELDTTVHGPLESAQPRFWIESGMDLVHVPSLTVWQELRRRPRQAAEQVQAVGIATFANAAPLPGVRRDLANLQTAFGAQVSSVHTGREVSESQLIEVLRRPGLAFVGTHGANLADQPLFSYLLCHSESGSDGRLMAGEIYGEDLQASIVVLSACYSGLADRSPLPGDDLFGIERALLQSGVRSVVTGVWDVYDDTGSELMKMFFGELRQAVPVAQALARTQRRFLEARRREGPGDPWIHPYFWAVYRVSGSDLASFQPGEGVETANP